MSAVEKIVQEKFQSGPGEIWALTPSDMAPLVGLSCSTLLAAFFIWIDWQPITGFRFDWVWHGLAIAAPLFGGIVLGALRGRVTTSAYLVLGFLAGVTGYVQMILLFALGRMDQALRISQNGQLYVPIMPSGWALSLVFYSMAGAFLAVVGGRLGTRLARQVQRELGAGPAVGSETAERWLKTLAPYFAAITTFLGIVFGPKH